jgi:lipopolysaccharide biosynthesis regulator YciM
MDTSLIVLIVLLVVSYAVNVAQYFLKKREEISDDLIRTIKLILGKKHTKAAKLFSEIRNNHKNWFEVNIALGNLYRQQGSLDKAISLHEELIRSTFTKKKHRWEALDELGYDYMLAGMYDKAEYIFKDLITITEYKKRAAAELILISTYQSDWDSAIKYTNMVFKNDEEYKNKLVNFYCEQANNHIIDNNILKAKIIAKMAQKINPDHPRINIINIDIMIKNRQFEEAKEYIIKLHDINELFIMLTVNNLKLCFQETSGLINFYSYISSIMYKSSNMKVFNSLLQSVDDDNIHQIAYDVVHRNDNLDRKFIKLLSFLLDKDNSPIITDSVKFISSINSEYVCQSCGLESFSHYWQCPSCRNWDAIQLRH